MRRPVWCSGFLVALVEERGNVRAAALAVGIDRSQVYRRRMVDRSFARDMDAAIQRAEDLLTTMASRVGASAVAGN